jgi:hypothetical protein
VEFGLTGEQQLTCETVRGLGDADPRPPRLRDRERDESPVRGSIVATISGGTSQIQRNAIARDLELKSY